MEFSEFEFFRYFAEQLTCILQKRFKNLDFVLTASNNSIVIDKYSDKENSIMSYSQPLWFGVCMIGHNFELCFYKNNWPDDQEENLENSICNPDVYQWCINIIEININAWKN